MSLIFDAPITRADLKGKRVTIVGLGKGRTSAGLAPTLVAKQLTRVSEQFGKALVDLERYLTAWPAAPDQAQVREQIQLIRKLLSHLN